MNTESHLVRTTSTPEVLDKAQPGGEAAATTPDETRRSSQ